MTRSILIEQLNRIQDINERIQCFRNSAYDDRYDSDHHEWLYAFDRDIMKSNNPKALMFKLAEAFKHLFGSIIIEKGTSFFMGAIITFLDELDEIAVDSPFHLGMIQQCERVGIQRAKECDDDQLRTKYKSMFKRGPYFMSIGNSTFTDIFTSFENNVV